MKSNIKYTDVIEKVNKEAVKSALSNRKPRLALAEPVGKSLELIPFFGQRVSCGLFGISEDYIENYQSLDERFVKNKSSTFFFQAEGSSMQPLIFSDDVLIVDRSIEYMHGRVSVFSLDGDMFCKRIFKRNGKLVLSSENKKFSDIVINEEQVFHLFGVVVAIARDIQ
ncbi:MAG: hypothetical protein HOO06_04390 [Bdellovibrionaceae bacterium]|nr:hypothetical protein [Pseudobdellovibrionaceae bacterium]